MSKSARRGIQRTRRFRASLDALARRLIDGGLQFAEPLLKRPLPTKNDSSVAKPMTKHLLQKGAKRGQVHFPISQDSISN